MAEQLSNNQSSNFAYPSQMQDISKSLASIASLLQGGSDTLLSLRREFRGEALWQGADGSQNWIQITKPLFIKMNPGTRKPLKENVKMPWGEVKECYVPNDEAIEEILSNLKFAGVNQITPLAGIDNDNYLDDLKEFECKLAGTFCLKQRVWGVDKELMPLAQFKIKTMVQDARSLALDGRTLKAIQTTVQRVEQMIDDRNKKQTPMGGAF
jgi:hypothetical protein